MPNTTFLGLPYPSLSNAPNVPQDLQNLATGVESKLIGIITCTSSTRPPVRDGAMIYETDTLRYMAYSSAAGAWQCVDSSERTFARKTSTQSVTNSTTLVSDNTLSLAVQANSTYTVNILLAYSGSDTADIKVLLRTPTGGSFQGMGVTLISSASSQQQIQTLPVGGNSSDSWGILSGGTVYGRVEGSLVTVGNSGNFTIEWAQNPSSGTATNVLAGSYLAIHRVA